jgi:phosphate transport system permease protein
MYAKRLDLARRQLRDAFVALEARGPIYLATTTAAGLLLLGMASLATNAVDGWRLVVLGGFDLAVLIFLLQTRREAGRLDSTYLTLLGAGILATTVLGALPPYFGLPAVNAVIHRSIPTAIILIPLGALSLSIGLYHLLGRTPGAEDLARYPLILTPALLALAAYLWLLSGLLDKALPNFDLRLVVQPYVNQQVPIEIVDATGTATSSLQIHTQPGFSNHLLGTIILVVLTTIISLPLGVGTGVYLSEYASGQLGSVVRFATTALRAISPFTIGLTALSMVGATTGTFLDLPFHGYHWANAAGKTIFVVDGGSFLPAAFAISLLVVPVIARATEEGCRSVPTGLREGSIALAASEGYTLVRIILPWAGPNVVTATLLGAAEAAGSLAPILFIAGTGENGVGLFSRVTTLTWAIFGSVYSVSKPFRDNQLKYQFDEGLLLLVIALGLSTVAVVLRRRFAQRYRGR